jgi:hypothetical protein
LAPENSWKPRGFALKEVLFKQFALSYTAWMFNTHEIELKFLIHGRIY